MARLAPPIVEGTIPSFYGTGLTVPYAMNRGVSTALVKELVLKIKTISSSTYLTTIRGNFDAGKSESYFDLTSIEDKLNPGQFYKVQLAYVDKNDEIGYYSAVSVVKYTTKPTVIIDDLNGSTVNNHKPSYIGIYRQDINLDITEKVYKYNFTVYDIDKNVFATSGDLLHNSNEDTIQNETHDVYNCPYELEVGKTYYIQYTITTINNMVVSSIRYRIQQKTSIDPNLNADIKVELNFDNGYISVSLDPYLDEAGEPIGSKGSFLLSRSCKDTDFLQWDNLTRFRLNNETAHGEIFKDFTIEQGKTYKYGISQYSDNGIYSNRKLSDEIYSDFEDSFLYDGHRQLKLRFNPLIGVFKTDVLEQKTDTIGSKYPFIFRNGSVNYKELSISGLVSYFMDEEQLFMTDEEMGLTTDDLTRESTISPEIDVYSTRTTSLSAYNFMAEREFKLRVLDWINDGRLKLFRSPAEGNYIVRLIASSMTPNNTVSRLIHTFNSQAYEMAECNYENLVEFGLINENAGAETVLKWASINVAKEIKSGGFETQSYNGQEYVKVNKNSLTTFLIEGLMPGTVIKLNSKSGSQNITIGITGAYYIDEMVEVEEVWVPLNALKNNNAVNIVYSYYDIVANVFDDIDAIEASTIPARQFLNGEEIIEALTKVFWAGASKYTKDPIIDIKTNISLLNRVSFSLKEGIGQKLYYYKDNYYTKMPIEAQDNWVADSPHYIYDYRDMDPYYCYPVYERDNISNEYVIKGFLKRNKNGVELKTDEKNLIDASTITVVSAGGSTLTMDLSDTHYFTTRFLTDMPQKIEIGTNVCADITYTSNTISYQIEDTDAEVKEKKQAWLSAKLELADKEAEIAQKGITNNKDVDTYSNEIKALKDKINNTYYEFIEILTAKLSEEGE